MTTFDVDALAAEAATQHTLTIGQRITLFTFREGPVDGTVTKLYAGVHWTGATYLLVTVDGDDGMTYSRNAGHVTPAGA